MESDPKIEEKGLVATVSEIQQDLRELLVREKVYKARAATWGVMGGAVITGLMWFFKFLFAKIFA